MPIVNCSYCNKEIYRQPNQLKNKQHSFCNRQCQSQWRKIHWVGKNSPAYKGRPPKKIPCSQCGKGVFRRQSNIEHKENVFCGRECKAIWQQENKINQHLKNRVIVQCDNCEKDIERAASHINNTNFCNHKCFGEWKRNNFTGEWNKKRFYPPLNKIIIKCDECGKSFERGESQRINKHSFCSRQCYGKWQSENQIKENSPAWRGGKIIVECANCGQSIERVRPEVESRSENFFCSIKCRGQWQSKNKTGKSHPNWKERYKTVCVYCNESIEIESWRKDRANMFFCNQECRTNWISENKAGKNSPLWKGGRLPYYGPNWYSQRRKARTHDNYTCQECGISEREHMAIYNRKLHVHHIVPFRKFGYVQGENRNHLLANHLSNLITVCQKCHVVLEHSTKATALNQ